MQDYNINVNYNGDNVKKTNPSSRLHRESKTTISKETLKESDNLTFKMSTRQAMSIGLGTSMKINQYVGELTENRVTQRKNQIGLTATALGLLALSNPIAAGLGGTALVGNSLIEYEIKSYKSNLTAGFLKDLSGGSYNGR